MPTVSSLQSLQAANVVLGSCPNGWPGLVLRDWREKRYNVGLAISVLFEARSGDSDENEDDVTTMVRESIGHGDWWCGDVGDARFVCRRVAEADTATD